MAARGRHTGGVGLNADSTTFTLQRSTDGAYWTGSGWQATAVALSATNSATSAGTAATWTSSASLPVWAASQSDAVYTIQATATDRDGNTFSGTAVSFTLDDTGPVTASVTTPAGGSSFRAATVPAAFSGIVADNSGGVGLYANSTTFTLQPQQRQRILDRLGLAGDRCLHDLAQQRDHRSNGSDLDQLRQFARLGGAARRRLHDPGHGDRQGGRHLRRHGRQLHPGR